jgi:hypothetical protein
MMENDTLEGQPYLIVEEMYPGYQLSLNRSKLKEPILRERRPWIKRVHVIQFDEYGCYVGKNFGRNPHYMISPHDYEKTVKKKCNLYGIPVKLYPIGKTISYSDTIACFNFNRKTDSSNLCPSTILVHDELAKMKLDAAHDEINSGIYDKKFPEKDEAQYVPQEKSKETNTAEDCELSPQAKIETQKTDEDNENDGDRASQAKKQRPKTDEDDDEVYLLVDEVRGARQKHFGYSANYNLCRLGKEEGGLVSPKLVGGEVPQDWKERFQSMTSLGDAMYSHPCAKDMKKDSSGGRLYDDEIRNARFASKIAKNSRVEALTYSQTQFRLTKDGYIILLIHVDTNNDDTESGRKNNYNYVLCTWYYIILQDGTLRRVAVLAYSRRSVGDFFSRGAACRTFLDKTMTPWLKNLPAWRKQVEPTRCIFHPRYFGSSAELGNGGELYFPPTINKQATYLSAFADACLRLKAGYEKTNRKKMTVEKQLESILPLVFSNSAFPYVSVVDYILDSTDLIKALEKRNVTVVFVETLVFLFTSIRCGGKPRHQPTFNKDPSDMWIFESLHIIRNAVFYCTTKTRYTYQCLNNQLKQIVGVGDLLSQHLAHVMALTSMIPAIFGAGAVVCTGTVTASRLRKVHGIKPSSFKCLMEHVCLEYEWLHYLAESGLCKVGQDPKVKFRDAIYPSQKRVMWIKKVEEEYRIMQLLRGDVGNARMRPGKLNTNLSSVTTSNSRCISTMRTVLENWWIPRKPAVLRVIKECHDSQVVKEGPSTSNATSRPSNRTSYKKRETVPRCASMGEQTIDWRRLDNQEMREYSEDFANELKTAAFQLHKKRQRTCFGTQHSSWRPSLDLRLVHEMGKHYCSLRNQKYKPNRHGVPGFARSSTNLLSFGIGVYPLDLFRMAERITRLCYVANTPEHTGGMNLVIECVDLRPGKNVDIQYINNGVAFGCQAHLKTAKRDGKKAKTLRTWTLNEGAKRCLVTSHIGTYCVRPDSTGMMSSMLGFSSKKKAKRSMLWYLITMKDHVDWWVIKDIPDGLWRHLQGMSFTVVSPPKYVIITSGDDGNEKGDVLCVLAKYAGGPIFAKVEESRTVFQISTENTVMQVSTDSIVEERKETDNMTGNIAGDTEDTQSVVLWNTTNGAVRSTPVCTRKKRSKTVVFAVPSEIDPFAARDNVTREEMETTLLKWSRVWTEVRENWKTSIVVRHTGVESDRYWHPPGTSVDRGSLRSKNDLQGFLNYSSYEVQKRCRDTTLDFNELLQQWSDTKPAGAKKRKR